MKKNIAVIFGDGVGPEVTQQSIKVLNGVAEQFGHQFKYQYALMGADAIDKTGNPLPDETIDTCLNSDAIRSNHATSCTHFNTHITNGHAGFH